MSEQQTHGPLLGDRVTIELDGEVVSVLSDGRLLVRTPLGEVARPPDAVVIVERYVG